MLNLWPRIACGPFSTTAAADCVRAMAKESPLALARPCRRCQLRLWPLGLSWMGWFKNPLIYLGAPRWSWKGRQVKHGHFVPQIGMILGSPILGHPQNCFDDEITHFDSWIPADDSNTSTMKTPCGFYPKQVNPGRLRQPTLWQPWLLLSPFLPNGSKQVGDHWTPNS